MSSIQLCLGVMHLPGYIHSIAEQILRTTVPFVTGRLEIFHCAHRPVITESDLHLTFCSTINAMSKKNIRVTVNGLATFTRDRICSDPFGIGSTLFKRD